MERKYRSPMMELLEVKTQDIITSSSPENDEEQVEVNYGGWAPDVD